MNDLEIVNFFSANPAADTLMFVNVAQQAGLVPPGTEATLLEQATRVKSIMRTISALGVSHVMRSINVRYLLTYLLTLCIPSLRTC